MPPIDSAESIQRLAGFNLRRAVLAVSGNRPGVRRPERTRMNCPKCQTPIADATVVKAAASINGKRNAGKGSRPGARGLIRNPAGRPPAKKPSP